MTDEHTSESELARLSEDTAHRLLARAIELDQSRGSETTVTELRDIAREAGISTQAFDAAFRELSAQTHAGDARPSPAPPRNFFGRLWHRLRGNSTSAPTIGDAVVSNAIAAVLFWVLVFLLTRIAVGIGWQAMEVAILIGCALGVGLARRLRARLVELGLMGMVAFQAAELAMHLLFGLRSVQGAETHFAVMIAGVLGAVIAWSASRKHDVPRDPAEHFAAAMPSSEPVDTRTDAPPEPDRHLRSLRLGTVLRSA